MSLCSFDMRTKTQSEADGVFKPKRRTEKMIRAPFLFIRRFVSTIALASLLLTPTSPQTPQPSPSQTTQQHQKPLPKCVDNGTYVNSKGHTVKRPENCSAAPQGATAQCRDGSYSFSQTHRGTCSHHCGVAKWL
jgi:Protein of unknown function (DUF3761)